VTGYLSFYDAAYPPASPPLTSGVCIYIGGDTPHIWTNADIAAQASIRYRLPVFVRSNPDNASPAADVTAAVTRLAQIHAPFNTLVCWDVETAIDPGYIEAVYRLLRAAQYQLIVYGSQSDVLKNQNPDDLYWGADWTGTAHLASGDAMTQYVSFAAYDEDLAVVTLPFWDTHPSPAPVSSWQEAMMQALPQLKNGATGAFVDTVQGLCCARGQTTAIDGNFGPQTQLAVEAVQRGTGISVDGVVGPETWPKLMGV
jgi:Putative peptidoglycan binding domain